MPSIHVFRIVGFVCDLGSPATAYVPMATFPATTGSEGKAELRTAVGEHMAVLIGLLLALAGLMTAVGVLGLMSAMSIAVVERTRELGVMRAVGATPATVLRLIMGEGVFVGAMSGFLAVALAAPLSAAVGALVGTMAFRAPLPLVMSPSAVLAWLVLVLLLSAAATAVPALRASRMTVREALVHI